MPKTHKTKTSTGIKFKPWYFLVLALISGLICVFALRANNEHMIKLRSAVYAADKSDTNVSEALQNLQAYVTRHMNTSLSTSNGIYPPIQLKYTYQRLLDQESTTAANNNATLYTDAQNYCQATVPGAFSGRTRIPCIEQYIESHTSLPAVPTSLYEFDFISPTWSPDLAGWSMAVAIILVVAFILSSITRLYLRKFD
ncbi:MAG TPA: hypothetical protein VL989_03445 [Candidatus Sulfotelmatobacter sp.]|nr:hypothetical protein [Candidatus Sulfotelmatobacter sp.]